MRFAKKAAIAHASWRRLKKVTDGPFAETRKQLGGYFLIDTRNAVAGCKEDKRYA
jgi:hypothetical protein